MPIFYVVGPISNQGSAHKMKYTLNVNIIIHLHIKLPNYASQDFHLITSETFINISLVFVL